MEYKSGDVHLITSYKNLLELTTTQLEAIRKGQYAQLNGIMEQKQIIMEHIDKVIQEYLGWEGISPHIKVEIRRLLLDINVLENESESLLSKSTNAIHREMMSLRTENQLYNKYNGGSMEKSRFLDEIK